MVGDRGKSNNLRIFFMLPSLTVAISSFGKRATRILPDTLMEQAGVDYLLLLQGETEIDLTERFKYRNDVRVLHLTTTGVAHSRNAALQYASGSVLLFADDDLELRVPNFTQLRYRFLVNADLDFICAQLQCVDGTKFKKYPPDGTKVSKVNSGKVGTPELAIKTCAFRKAKLRFDVNFGAGSQLWLGDEYIFICDALRAGLSGSFASICLATHAGESSGSASCDKSMSIRKVVLQRALHPVSWPYRVVFALKHRNKFRSVSSFLKFLGP